jgi:predicted molibdopterin-dependent oxidoreductase YjgC
MNKKISLTINGIPWQARFGQTILDAARDAGIRIPTLCYHERLQPIGSCRLCIVDVLGSSAPVAACTTPVREGMVVATHSPEVEHLRHDTLLLLLINHRLDCDTCPLDGECQVQDLACRYGVTQAEIDALGFCPVPKGPVTYGATPLITYHPDRCILCGRCVKACEEICEQGVLTFAGTGAGARIAPIEATSGFAPQCLSCGECMSVCPVNALTATYASCALPKNIRLKKVRTVCPYCGCGCEMDVKVHANRVLGPASSKDGVNDGSLCAKGRFGLDFIHSPNRITQPMIRTAHGFKNVSWDEALDFTAEKLLAIRRSHGPDALAGLSSARCTNEENYLFQKLFRGVIGTNNVDHCARL